MDRHVGEVSEGLVLDLSVQSKRATEVIAGIGHTLDGVGDFSNVNCSSALSQKTQNLRRLGKAS